MFKYYSVLLLLSIFNYLIISCDSLSIRPRDKLFNQIDVMNHMVVTILKNCKLGIKNIGVYDNSTDLSTSKAVSVLQPTIAVSLISNLGKIKIYKKLTNVEIQGIIFLIDTKTQWALVLLYIAKFWKCNTNCTVIAMSKSDYACQYEYDFLILMSRLYISTAYYVCATKNRRTIYTHDLYGNTDPSYWHIQGGGILNDNNWTYYGRIFTEASICKGFSFNRKSIISDGLLHVGMYTKMDPDFFPNKGIGGYVNKDHIEEEGLPENQGITSLRKLLKTKFRYALFIPRNRDTTSVIYRDTIMDILFIHITNDDLWDLSYPMEYSDLYILSRNRGNRTPLETIIEFYGIWTLISLILLLSITFIVIWRKTRNVTLAGFNIVRLLINTEIHVPINTASLKIYFSIIFLYFLIIHATFSGNLSKFLTIPILRTNVETIQDLKDSRIEKVYCDPSEFNEVDLAIFKSKVAPIFQTDECVTALENPRSVCIVPKDHATYMNIMESNNFTVYASRSKVFTIPLYQLYRPRLPCKERIDWALMTMKELAIQVRSVRNYELFVNEVYLRKWKKTQINHRSIKLKDLYFAFILLIIGNSLGILCFIFEKIIYWHRNRRKSEVVQIFGNTAKKGRWRRILTNIRPKIDLKYFRHLRRS